MGAALSFPISQSICVLVESAWFRRRMSILMPLTTLSRALYAAAARILLNALLACRSPSKPSTGRHAARAMTTAGRNTRTCLQDLVDMLTVAPSDYCSILAKGGGGEPFTTAYRTVTA